MAKSYKDKRLRVGSRFPYKDGTVGLVTWVCNGHKFFKVIADDRKLQPSTNQEGGEKQYGKWHTQ